MNATLIVYLSLIFLFLFPFPMDFITFISLRTKQAGSNFRLGFFTIDIGIEADNSGLHIKGLTPKEEKLIKSSKNRIKLLYHPSMLDKVTIDSVHVVFQYGNQSSIFNTCMACSVIDNISSEMYKVFKDKIRTFKKTIIPVFDKDSLYFQLRVDLKVNLFIIFSALFKIILLKLTKILKLGENLYEQE